MTPGKTRPQLSLVPARRAPSGVWSRRETFDDRDRESRRDYYSPRYNGDDRRDNYYRRRDDRHEVRSLSPRDRNRDRDRDRERDKDRDNRGKDSYPEERGKQDAKRDEREDAMDIDSDYLARPNKDSDRDIPPMQPPTPGGADSGLSMALVRVPSSQGGTMARDAEPKRQPPVAQVAAEDANHRSLADRSYREALSASFMYNSSRSRWEHCTSEEKKRAKDLEQMGKVHPDYAIHKQSLEMWKVGQKIALEKQQSQMLMAQSRFQDALTSVVQSVVSKNMEAQLHDLRKKMDQSVSLAQKSRKAMDETLTEFKAAKDVPNKGLTDGDQDVLLAKAAAEAQVKMDKLKMQFQVDIASAEEAVKKEAADEAKRQAAQEFERTKAEFKEELKRENGLEMSRMKQEFKLQLKREVALAVRGTATPGMSQDAQAEIVRLREELQKEQDSRLELEAAVRQLQSQVASLQKLGPEGGAPRMQNFMLTVIETCEQQERRHAESEERFKNIEANQGHASEGILDLAARVERHDEKFSYFDAKHVADTIYDWEGEIQEFKRAVPKLRADVDLLVEQIKATAAEAANAFATASAAAASSNTSPGMGLAGPQVAQINDRIAMLEKGRDGVVALLTEALGGMSSRVSNLENRIVALESRPDQSAMHASAIAALRSELEGTVKASTNALAQSMGEHLAGLQIQLKTHDSRLNETSSRGVYTQLKNLFANDYFKPMVEARMQPLLGLAARVEALEQARTWSNNPSATRPLNSPLAAGMLGEPGGPSSNKRKQPSSPYTPVR